MKENTRIFYETIKDMPEEKKVELWNKHLTGAIVNYGEVILDDELGCQQCIFYDETESMEKKKICCSLSIRKVKNGKCQNRMITHRDNFKSLALTLVLGITAMIVGTVVLMIVTR